MLSSRDAFKVGFLGRCVERGMSPSQIKEAADKLAGLLGDAVGAVGGAAKGVTNAALGWGIPLAAAAPPVLGGMAGFGLAKATDIDDTDIDDIKDREVIDEYRRQAERLNRQRLVRQYAQSRRRTGRIFS